MDRKSDSFLRNIIVINVVLLSISKECICQITDSLTQPLANVMTKINDSAKQIKVDTDTHKLYYSNKEKFSNKLNQHSSSDYYKNIPVNVRKQLSKNENILYAAIGYLNADSKKDYAFIIGYNKDNSHTKNNPIQSPFEKAIQTKSKYNSDILNKNNDSLYAIYDSLYNQPRSIYIFISTAKNKYVKLCPNNSLVLCRECGPAGFYYPIFFKIKDKKILLKQVLYRTPYTEATYAFNFIEDKKNMELNSFFIKAFKLFTRNETKKKYGGGGKLQSIDFCTMAAYDIEKY